MVGICPNCHEEGEVGTACPEKPCRLRGYHRIPHGSFGGERLDSEIGLLLDRRYLLVKKLGEGGFGRVFVALQQPLGMEVALKVLKRDGDPEMHERRMRLFKQEAQAMAQLQHPNIVRIVDFGFFEGAAYLVMELIHGARTLKDEIKTRARAGEEMGLDEVEAILGGVLSALAAAHERHIIHRDVKPENIMLQSAPGHPVLPRLLDFGLAKFVDEDTQSSAILGTPAYMAPEQLTKRDPGPWTDLYALGIVAYELMTGRKPFQGEVARVLADKRDPHFDVLEAVRDVALPAPIVSFLRTALAFGIDERFGSAAAFREAMAAAFAAARGAEERRFLSVDLTELLRGTTSEVGIASGGGRRSAAASHSAPIPSAAHSADHALWHYAVGNDRKGPVPRATLRSLLATGEISSETYVWQPGRDNWVHLGDVASLKDLVAGVGGDQPQRTAQLPGQPVGRTVTAERAPARAEAAAAAPAAGGRRWLVPAVAVAVVAVGAVVAVVAGSSSASSDPPKEPARAGLVVSHAADAGSTRVAPDTMAAVPAEVPPTEPAAPTVAEKVAEALVLVKAAVAEERWEDADKKVQAVLVLDADNDEAKTLAAQIAREHAVARVYEAARDALAAGEAARAWQALQGAEPIPDGSVYATRVEELRRKVASTLAGAKVDEAKAALGRKRYSDAITLADEALAFVPGHEEATAVKARANRLRLVPKEEPTRPTTKPPMSPATNAPTAQSGKDLYAAARRIHNSDPSGALKLYEQSAAKGYSKAYKQIGSVQVKLGNSAAAVKAYKRYLALNPSARDADTVRDIIIRLGGSP